MPRSRDSSMARGEHDQEHDTGRYPRVTEIRSFSAAAGTDHIGTVESIPLPPGFPRAALDSLSEAIVVIDEASTILYFSPASTELFGYTTHEAVGHHIGMLMPKHEAENHDGYVRHHLETGARRIIGRTREVTGRAKDGRLIAIDLRVVPVTLDGRRCFIGSMRDVTERKAREAALQSLTDRLGNQVAMLDAILANIEEGVCLFDSGGKLISCNPRTLTLLDLPANVVVPGMSLDEMIDLIVGLGIVAADEAPVLREQRIARDGPEHGGKRALRLANGRILRVLHRKIPDGRSIATYRDITATESAAAQLRTAIERAEDASRSKSTFLANMSHELRTPLNGILGITEALTLGYFGSLDAQQANYLKEVHAAGRHLLRIINGILDLARIESGRFDLMEVAVGADELADEALLLVAGLARNAGLTIERRGAPQAVLLRVDRQAMVQVLVNLLSNAIKFTPRGRRVTLSWRGAARGAFVFDIRDEGIGMKPDEIDLALTPYGQTESSRTKRHEGTGLGLPLAQHMVGLHGGRLTVESEPDKGTTVTVLLPASRVIAREDRRKA